ncbi:hypothetical protein ACJIZ3_008769 [Penstemon smallii]|uniref:Uncharacterized protein n=1 Tax=Penstemon smallii TaxID=265156 RepID=A0ABD3TCU1_9LAMI
MAFPNPNWRESLNLGLGFSLLILRRALSLKLRFSKIWDFLNEVAMIISNDPTILSSSIDNRIIPSLSLLKGLFDSNVEVAKVLKGSRRFLSMDLENVLLNTLRDLGFSEVDILKVFRNAPLGLGVSVEKMKKVKDKRYKPRLQVLVDLEKRNLIMKWPHLSTLYSVRDEKFFEKFVALYLDDEVGETFIAKNSVHGKGEPKIARKYVKKLCGSC